MFDELIRAMKALAEQKLQIGLPTDAEGYLDRECPSPECGAGFKVLLEDWTRETNGEHAYCCRCGHTATGDHWFTAEQVAKIESSGQRHVHAVIHDAVQRDARRLDQLQRPGSFLRMRIEAGAPSLPPEVQAKARDLLTQKVTCSQCGCRYACLGAPFFCPLCGHDDPAPAFRAAIEATRASVTRLSEVQQLLEGTAGKDIAADAARGVLEDSMARLVAAFEAFCKGVFRRIPEATGVTVAHGAFQRLDDGSALWTQVGRAAYADVLGPIAWARLRVLYQRRHLLSHNEGRVDRRYLDHSGDQTYALGQRIVVQVRDVLELADLLERLAESR